MSLETSGSRKRGGTRLFCGELTPKWQLLGYLHLTACRKKGKIRRKARSPIPVPVYSSQLVRDKLERLGCHNPSQQWCLSLGTPVVLLFTGVRFLFVNQLCLGRCL